MRITTFINNILTSTIFIARALNNPTNVFSQDLSVRKRSSNSNINDRGDCENYSQDEYYDEWESRNQRENKRSCATTTFLLAIDIFTIALIVILFSKITVKNCKTL